MYRSFDFFVTFCAAIAAVCMAAQETPGPQMTARELFYNAGNSAPKTAAQPPAKVVAKRKPAAPAQQQASAPPPSPVKPAAPSGSAGGTAIIPVSDTARTTAPAPAAGTALGLKYTLLKLSGNGMMPAAPSSVFHAGDKIQFSIETNSPGYLYIINQGSSGTWKPVFPAPEIEGGDNRVEAFRTYTFPSGYRFVFDQQAGEEKVFIIFSRDPKPDFEQLVYSLQSGKTNPASQPASQPQQAAHVLRASIDDSAVGRLHQTYSRDLVIERVGDDAHPSPDNAAQEKAVYVVNPTGNADSALIADLRLVHQ